MKKYFIDSTHVMTDYMGGWSNQWIEIGWYDNRTNSYFNLDEVKYFFEKGETENVGQNEDGSLYMKSYWLDARTAFTIVCGIPFNTSESNQNLLEYAKSIGLVHEQPIPIKMFSGTKMLLVKANDLFNVQYKINKDVYKQFNQEWIEKLCIGKIKRIKLATHEYHHDGIIENVSDFMCGDISFDSNNRMLTIHDIPKNEICKRILIDAIRNLDIEILIANHGIVNFSNVLSACRDYCLDCDQPHWIGEKFDDYKKKSNLYWYDK